MTQRETHENPIQRDEAQLVLAKPGDAATTAEPARVVIVNTFPVREVVRAALGLFAVILGIYIVYRIQDVILLLLLAIFLATAIEPIVNRLRRGPFNRGAGILIVYAVIVFVLAGVVALIVPQLINQASTFIGLLPERLAALRVLALDIEFRLVRDAILSAIDSIQSSTQSGGPLPSESITTAGSTLAHFVINFMTVFVLAFYWLTERNRFKRLILRISGPVRARSVNLMWVEVEEKLGGWVRGQLLLMGAMGVMAAVGYTLLGLPDVALLALIAAIGEGIPLIGTVIGFAPAVIVGLTIDPSKAVFVLIYCLVAQQFESNVLVPRIMARTVGISPLTVILGILVGAALYGLPGAFLAVPVAGAIQVILAHLFRVEDPAQRDAHHGDAKPEHIPSPLSPASQEVAREAIAQTPSHS